MLYISRIAGINKWGVTDSDDGIETVITLSQLEKNLLLGLEIEGVEFAIRTIHGRRRVDIKRVSVYQDAKHSTAHRAKAIVMNGVDMRIKGGSIFAVSWDSSRLKPGISIRLSGYGRTCENFVFVSTPTPPGEVTIVLDDRIKVKKQSFKRAFNLTSLKVDLREVTSPRTATYVYEEYFLSYNGMTGNIDNRIIDTPERKELWCAIDVVFHGRANFHAVSPDISAAVAKKFQGEFAYFADLPLKLMDGKVTRNNLQIYANRIARNVAFWRSNCQDYDTVKAHDEHVLHALRVTVPTNYYKITRFANFMEWFEPNEEIKAVFVKLCNRANNWFLDVAEAEGLLI